MTKISAIPSEQFFGINPVDKFIPTLETTPAEESKTVWNYHKSLRNFFRDGMKKNPIPQNKVTQAFKAQLAGTSSLIPGYPALYDNADGKFYALPEILKELVTELYSEEETNVLIADLPKIIHHFHQKLGGLSPITKYSDQIRELIQTFRLYDGQVSEPDLYMKKCELLERKLLSGNKIIFGFSGLTAFQLLDFQLKAQQTIHANFLQLLKKTINGIKDTLKLQEEDDEVLKNQLDFADELISFDKIEKLEVPGTSSKLPEERILKLKNCVDILEKGRAEYAKAPVVVFTSERLETRWNLKKVIHNAVLETSSESPFKMAKAFYQSKMNSFVEIIAALRMAELEINQQYESNIHDTYFAGFDLSFLRDEDLRNFYTIIVLEESTAINDDSGNFEWLMAESAMIKVLSLNPADDLSRQPEAGKETESFLDLAAMAIFRRQTNIYQGGIDQLEWVNESFMKGLHSSTPVLWNILLPLNGEKELVDDFIRIKTAVGSRYFPIIEYAPNTGFDFGIPLNLSLNDDVEADFPNVHLSIKADGTEDNKSIQLTPADFFSLNPESISQLEIIPPSLEGDFLINVSDYLTHKPEALTGKIPYVFVVDSNGLLRKAAIPASWIKRCRARMEYWNFLKALDGSHNFKTIEALEKEKRVWEEQKQKDIQLLKDQMSEAFEQTRLKDIEQAIYQILNGLIDGKITAFTDLQQAIKPGHSEPPVEVQEAKTESIQKIKEEKPEAVEPVTVQSEVWVETDECTSCSDCTDSVPGVFKYNANKQAVVHNPKGAPFAKIVAAAEKCPARCIHPGTPQNPKEPELEKWIKRAEKFN